MTRRPVIINCTLSLLLSALLVVQGAMPAGYMPASIDSGWPVMLCPNGLPAGFLLERKAAAEHSRHVGQSATHDQHSLQHQPPGAAAHDHETVSDSGYCPLGSALNTSAIVAAIGVAEDAPKPLADWSPSSTLARPGLRLYGVLSRGPPTA